MADDVALVLAGSQGLGRASAAALLDRGFAVGVLARRQGVLDEAVEALSERGSVVGICGDVRYQGDVARAVEETTQLLGPISAIVANAGGPQPGGFFEMEESDWDYAYALTLKSVVHAVRAVVGGMIERGYGRIVVVGSSSVRKPIPNLVLSNVLRPAVAGLVKDLAVSLAPNGITVNLVCPGRIATERIGDLDRHRAQNLGVTEDEVRLQSVATIPIGRYGKPEEFGHAVGFLASPEASYLTGQTLFVDGGLVCVLP